MVLTMIILSMISGMGNLSQIDKYQSERMKMVTNQIIARGITDRETLAAMRKYRGISLYHLNLKVKRMAIILFRLVTDRQYRNHTLLHI